MCGPAFNALRPGYWMAYNMLEPDMKEKIDSGKEHIVIKIRYGGMLPFRRDFAENSAKLEVDYNTPIDIPCPVRIIHGVQVKTNSRSLGLLSLLINNIGFF